MTLDLLLIAVLALIIMGVSAPYETLGWWAGWYGDRLGPDDEGVEEPEAVDDASKTPRAGHYVVYLTGIGGTSPEEFDPLEQAFLARLKAKLPDAELVDDVFPYSSDNRALTGERFFGWFWRYLVRMRGRGGVGVLAVFINLRNLWQVLVSSDSRFGPLYNFATSEHILKQLHAHGYVVRSGVPLTLIGYSGGGQISTGAAPLLKEYLDAPVSIISLGGVMDSNDGVLALDSLTHLYGSKDTVQRLGYIMFAQRWPALRYSPWNQARAQGIITRQVIGPMVHTGPKGYLDDQSYLPDGQSYLDHTVDIITDLIHTQTSHLQQAEASPQSPPNSAPQA